MKNKIKSFIMGAVVSFVVILCAFGACTAVNDYVGLEDDNIIEEFVEKQIENQVGIDIDLSPESDER